MSSKASQYQYYLETDRKGDVDTCKIFCFMFILKEHVLYEKNLHKLIAMISHMKTAVLSAKQYSIISIIKVGI